MIKFQTQSEKKEHSYKINKSDCRVNTYQPLFCPYVKNTWIGKKQE